MKRFLVFLLALATVLCLAACEGGTDESKKPSNVDATAATDVSTPIGGSFQDGATEAPAELSAATIAETVIFEGEGVKVTAKSLVLDGFMGPQIKLLIENDSGKDLTFQCRDASVNGYMVEALMSVDVVSGKKANDMLTFMNSDLAQCGIQAIADIAFRLHIFESDSWQTFTDTDMIELKTSLADGFTYTFDDSGDVAYDGNGVKIVVKGLEEDGWLGPSVIVYICNENANDITVQVRDASVNGFMVQAVCSADVLSGKHCVTSITFLNSDLEENGITSVENIALGFRIFNKESWSTIVDTDIVTIIPE